MMYAPGDRVAEVRSGNYGHDPDRRKGTISMVAYYINWDDGTTSICSDAALALHGTVT